MYISIVISPIFRVTYPIFARAFWENENIESAYRQALIKINKITALLTVLIIIICPVVFKLLLPETWSESGQILQLLLLLALLHPLHSLAHNILLASGSSGTAFGLGLVKGLILTAFYFTYSMGITSNLVIFLLAS